MTAKCLTLRAGLCEPQYCAGLGPKKPAQDTNGNVGILFRVSSIWTFFFFFFAGWLKGGVLHSIKEGIWYIRSNILGAAHA